MRHYDTGCESVIETKEVFCMYVMDPISIHAKARIALKSPVKDA